MTAGITARYARARALLAWPLLRPRRAPCAMCPLAARVNTLAGKARATALSMKAKLRYSLEGSARIRAQGDYSVWKNYTWREGWLRCHGHCSLPAWPFPCLRLSLSHACCFACVRGRSQASTHLPAKMRVCESPVSIVGPLQESNGRVADCEKARPVTWSWIGCAMSMAVSSDRSTDEYSSLIKLSSLSLSKMLCVQQITAADRTQQR